MKRVHLLLSFALGLLLIAPRAHASEPFTETIQSDLGLAERPLCTVCHLTLIGGRETVTRPFGITAQKKYGVTLLNVPALRKALMDMAANKDDSDKDGLDDITELKAGTDPNVPEGETATDDGPQFGCQFAATPAGAGVTWAMGAWIAGLAISSWRRTRREGRAGARPIAMGLRASSVIEMNAERKT
jgi:hypothetical protein